MTRPTSRKAARLGRAHRFGSGPLLAALLALPLLACAGPSGPPQTVVRKPAPAPERTEREKNERKALAHYKLGIENLRIGQPALAIRELRTALEYNPDDPWGHLSIAEAYRLKGHPKMGEDHLLRALDLKPGFQQARLNLSALYIQMGRYEDSVAQTSLLLGDPTFPVPWKALTNQGYAEFKLERYTDARRSLELAREYHPNYWQAVLNLGILEATEGNRLEALERFEQVLALSPGPLAEAEVNYRMGEIYIALGNRARAMDHLASAAANTPAGPWGKRSEDYLKRLR